MRFPSARVGPMGLRTVAEKLLRAADFEERLGEWSRLPPRPIVNTLFSYICSADERVKWHAVTAMGLAVARLADEDLEAGRVIMRRHIWNLNDESGGIGWGAPEAMGEILACHERLAGEYAHLLLSYIRPDGNRLEHALLERGVLWGLGRLAQARPHLLEGASAFLLPYLGSEDPFHRGLAAWALGNLGGSISPSTLEALLTDTAHIHVYEGGALSDFTVRELAERALKAPQVLAPGLEP